MNSSKTAQKVEPARHWINGEWVGSSAVAKSVSPSTGEVLGQYSAGGRTEAASAITAARKAFDTGSWSHDPQLRSRALLELADRLDQRADAIALPISREQGKPLRHTRCLSQVQLPAVNVGDSNVEHGVAHTFRDPPQNESSHASQEADQKKTATSSGR